MLRPLDPLDMAKDPNLDGIRNLDVDLAIKLADFADQLYVYFALIILPLVVGICIVISHGIKHGGPLRLFFLGVTVPALTVYVVSNAFS